MIDTCMIAFFIREETFILAGINGSKLSSTSDTSGIFFLGAKIGNEFFIDLDDSWTYFTLNYRKTCSCPKCENESSFSDGDKLINMIKISHLVWYSPLESTYSSLHLLVHVEGWTLSHLPAVFECN